MILSQASKVYQQEAKQVRSHPSLLISKLYERVLFHIEKVETAVREQNQQKSRGHLGKAIGIITELYSFVDEKDESEEAHFLRNVYGAILIELPKVSDSHDIHILKKAQDYLERLKKVWEEALV